MRKPPLKFLRTPDYRLIVIGLFLLGLLFRSYASINLFGYVVYGEWMIDHGALLDHDVFSFTIHGRDWINHEWLFHLLVGGVYRAGGWLGLKGLHLVFCSVLAFGLVYPGRRSSDFPSHLLTLLFPVLAILPGTSLKASMVTFLFLIVLMGSVRNGVPEVEAIWWVPVLFVPWANLHGGFILGLALLTAYLPHWYLESSGERTFGYPVIVLASYFVTLINPFGWKLWLMIYHTAVDPMTIRMIAEWQPTWTSPYYIAVWLGLTGQFVVGVRRQLKTRGPGTVIARNLPVVMFGLLALWPRRNIAFYGFAVLFLAPSFRMGLPDGLRRRTVQHGLLVGVALAGLFLLVNSLVRPFHTGPMQYPEDHLEALRSKQGPKRVLVHYPWAEWLLFHRRDTTVFLDLRWKTVYSTDVIKDYLQAVLGEKSVLRRYNVNWVLLPERYYLNETLSRSGKWELIQRTKTALLWSKSRK